MSQAPSSAARRYAEAAFAVAREQRDVKGWLSDIGELEQVFDTPEAEQVFSNPRVDEGKRIGIALSLAPKGMKADRLNFLKLLVLARRTGEISAIRQIFEGLVAASEGRVELLVTLSREPSADDRRSIAKLLSERAGQEASVEYSVDPNILGGLVIRRGDHVVDASLRRRLVEMREQLVAS